VAEPIEMVMTMLREMRAEDEARHGEVLARFDRVEQRLQKLEGAQMSLERALEARP
jgi:hypothetical protein